MKRKDLRTIKPKDVDTQVSIFANNCDEIALNIVIGSTSNIVNAIINLNVGALKGVKFRKEADRTDAVAQVCRVLIHEFNLKPEDLEEPEVDDEELNDIGAKLIKTIEDIIKGGNK